MPPPRNVLSPSSSIYGLTSFTFHISPSTLDNIHCTVSSKRSSDLIRRALHILHGVPTQHSQKTSDYTKPVPPRQPRERNVPLRSYDHIILPNDRSLTTTRNTIHREVTVTRRLSTLLALVSHECVRQYDAALSASRNRCI